MSVDCFFLLLSEGPKFILYLGIMTTQRRYMMVCLFPMDLVTLLWLGMLFLISARYVIPATFSVEALIKGYG